MLALTNRLRVMIAFSPLVLGLLPAAPALADPNGTGQPANPRLRQPTAVVPVQRSLPPLVVPQPPSPLVGDCGRPTGQCGGPGQHPNQAGQVALDGQVPAHRPVKLASTTTVRTCQKTCPANSRTCVICTNVPPGGVRQGVPAPKH